MKQDNTDKFRNAVSSFERGEPLLVYDADDREGEVDLIYPAGEVQLEDIVRMRNDAGGLICVAVSDTVATSLELPFLHDELDHPAAIGNEMLEYDDRSAASLTVNHSDTVTGIVDEDRLTTIQALSTVAADPNLSSFAEQFRTPGHVHLLRAAPDLLLDRRGHTECAVALAVAADLPPAAVVCEMLDDESGGALSPEAAKTYAEREGIVYVEIEDIADGLT